MKKVVKRIGNSMGITFTKPEMEIYKFGEGSIIDLSDAVFKSDEQKIADENITNICKKFKDEI